MAHPGLNLLGKYRLRALQGGHPAGERWSAVDLRLDEPVMVLVLPLSAARRLVRRDTTVLQRLATPHLATVLDHAPLDDGHVALVLPVPTGQPLAEWLETASPESLATVVVQLAHGLWAIHARGLAHGAIRPAVIRVGPGPHACLYEGGLARLLTDAGLTERLPALAGPDAAPEGPGAPAADLHALARALHRLGAAPGGLLGDALAAAADPDPARRPADAAALLALIGHPEPPRPTSLSRPPRAVGATVVDTRYPAPVQGVSAGATISDRPSAEHATEQAPPAPEPDEPPVAKRDELAALDRLDVHEALLVADRGGSTAPVAAAPRHATTMQMKALRPAPRQAWPIVLVAAVGAAVAAYWMWH